MTQVRTAIVFRVGLAIGVSCVAPRACSAQEEAWERVTTYVLLVGASVVDRTPANAGYRHLPIAENDAADMAAFLSNIRNVQILEPLIGAAATKQNIEYAAKYRVASQLKVNDRIIFYYSGHGLRLNEQSYMLSGGGQANDPETMLSRADLNDWVHGIWSRAGHILFIVDACLFGSELKGSSDAIEPLTDEEKRSVQTSRKSRFLMAASGNQEYALANSPDTRHSLFTYHLLEGLSGSADILGGDGIISQLELAHWIEDKATAKIMGANGRESWTMPSAGGILNDERGAFLFRSPSGGRPSAGLRPSDPRTVVTKSASDPVVGAGRDLHVMLADGVVRQAGALRSLLEHERTLFRMESRSRPHFDGLLLENFSVDSDAIEPPLVRSLDPGSPAAASGLEPGDVILRIDDESVLNTIGLYRYFGGTTPSQHVTLTVARGPSTMLTVPITMPEVVDSGVRDLRTGLVWRSRPSGWAMTYTQAVQYVHLLNARGFLGRSDWRLPVLHEVLFLIADAKRTQGRLCLESAAESGPGAVCATIGEWTLIAKDVGLWTTDTYDRYRWFVNTGVGEAKLAAAPSPTIVKNVLVVAGPARRSIPRN